MKEHVIGRGRGRQRERQRETEGEIREHHRHCKQSGDQGDPGWDGRQQLVVHLSHKPTGHASRDG